MSDIVIRARELGKKYLIGHQAERERYTTLRDVAMRSAGTLWRKTRDLIHGRPIIQGDELEEVWALRNVNFEIGRGEAVGIIGRNGAGKSTLLKILSRITEPSSGRVEIRGRVASLLEVGTGFHPELTGRENIYLNGAILGMSRGEIKGKFDSIVSFAEIDKYLDTPVKRYSSGMYVRLAFAVAAHLDPEILVVDEVLAVGDTEFQKKCQGKMSEIGQGGRTVLFVSHNLNLIGGLCPRSILLDKGSVVMDDDTDSVLHKYVTSYQKTNGQLSWEDPQLAPGSQKLKLNAVSMVTPEGQITTDLDIQQEAIFRVRYWNLKQDAQPVVSVIVRNELDEPVFSSINLRSESTVECPWFDRPLPVGLFETECRFPANLFNTATYSIDLHLNSTLHNTPIDVAFRSILYFSVHDFRGRDISGVRWQGSLRPKLAWKTQLLQQLDSSHNGSVISNVDE